MKLLSFAPLLIGLASMGSSAVRAQAPCQPADPSTRCALERVQKSTEDYRANQQKNLENLEQRRQEQEERERVRKADCLAKQGNRPDVAQICGT